jgi:hypothetical protein
MSAFRTTEPNTAQFQAELVKLQSELARERPREAAPPPEPPPARARRGSRLVLTLVALAVILVVLFGPGLLGSILDRWDYTSSARHW